MTCAALVAAALTLVVKTGMAPGDNPLAVSPIDGLSGPVEVTASDGSKVPCAVRTDGDGRRFVAFRLGGVEMLKRLEYHVGECAAAGEEPDGVPKVLPGMNLIGNPDLSRRDEDGNPVGWWPSSGRSVGTWTGGKRANVASEGGATVFSNGCWMAYVDGLEEGHVYRVSFDVISDAEQAGLIVWYCGKEGRWSAPRPGISNYKCSKDIPKTEQWTHVEDSSFVYFDNALKRHVFSNVKLLPGTGAACVQVYAKKGRVALRNLRYEDVTLDSGLKTELILPGADAAAPDCAGAELGVAGDSAEFFFNDKKVGEYRNLTPSSGRIQLQSEGFGIEYRNIVMYPTKRR